MLKKAVVITTNGEFIEKQFTNNAGDMISEYFPNGPEIVRPKRLLPEYCMVVDDMGHMKNLDINSVGSYLYCSDEHGHFIVGDIIFLRITGPNVFGLSEGDIKYLKSEYLAMAKIGKTILDKSRAEANQ